MATKDDCLFFKNKQNFVVNDNLNGQFNNLNLNQNNQCFTEIVQSRNVENHNKKISNYDYSHNNDLHIKQNGKSFGKSKLGSSFANLNAQKDYGKKENSKISNKNSTLSLHISAYENSIEAISGDSIGDSEKKKESISSIKSWKAVKETFKGSTSAANYAFEFPRQQQDQKNNPEVMQFKASQQLSNVNAAPTPSKAKQTNFMDRNVTASGDLKPPPSPFQQHFQPQNRLATEKPITELDYGLRKKPMIIFVQLLNGQTLDIIVNETDTIAKVKSQVKEKTGLSVNEQRLIFCGQQLEEQQSLANYNVKNMSSLHLNLRLPGGMQKIYLKNSSNRTFLVDVNETSTIDEIKAMLRERESENDAKFCGVFVRDQEGEQKKWNISGQKTLNFFQALITEKTGVPVERQNITFANYQMPVFELDEMMEEDLSIKYSPGSLLERAEQYYLKDDLVQAAEKCWCAIVYSIKMLFLCKYGYHNVSHSSNIFLAKKAIDTIEDDTKRRLMIAYLEQAEEFHRFFNGSSYYCDKVTFYNRIQNMKYFVETFEQIDADAAARNAEKSINDGSADFILRSGQNFWLGRSWPYNTIFR